MLVAELRIDEKGPGQETTRVTQGKMMAAQLEVVAVEVGRSQILDILYS